MLRGVATAIIAARARGYVTDEVAMAEASVTRIVASREEVRVLQNRARGKTTQSLLIDTILFLLERGPMTTAELQPLIQHLQPDLCDDSVDRVIDGVHFGKKWKHHVRSTQQALKRSGRIRFDGTHWHLIASPMSNSP